jgi:aminopeptidase YwaD
MMRLFLVLLFLPLLLPAQDSAYTRRTIDSLCAPRYHGRGYVANGDNKAAAFILREVKKKGLRPLHGKHEQPFSFAVNSFPGAMSLSLNGLSLRAGLDFQPNPNSVGGQGTYKAFHLKNKHVRDAEAIFRLSNAGKLADRFVIVDATNQANGIQSFLATIADDPLKARGYLLLTDKKLTWSVGRRLTRTPVLETSISSAPKRIRQVSISMDHHWEDYHQAKNIYALIPGQSDSMVLFTAHYDHLGRMGKDTYIPGASDNASGTAMLLDLADYFVAHPPPYTLLFVWFAGEEAGLVGSKHFVEHAPIDLTQIVFLMNLDLMADGKTGITVVNGKIFTSQFERLSTINQAHGLLQEVKARGAAANSDHFPFYEKGVPSFFIYTTGDYKHYHDVYDTPDRIPMARYTEVFELITKFVEGL